MSQPITPLQEALALIQEANMILLGQTRPSQGMLATVRDNHRDACLLITRYLAGEGA